MPRRVLVVSPPYQYQAGPKPHSRVAEPAVGSLVTYLRRHEIQATGYMAAGTGPEALPTLADQVLHLVDLLDIHIVGVSVNYMPNLPAFQALGRRLYEERPHVLIVVGGSIVTGLVRSGEAKVWLPWCDVIIPGDGEEHLYDLATASERPKRAPVPVVFPQRDTAAIPPVLFEHVLFGTPRHPVPLRFEDVTPEDAFTYEVISGRGCCFDCTFCISPHMGALRRIFRPQ